MIHWETMKQKIFIPLVIILFIGDCLGMIVRRSDVSPMSMSSSTLLAPSLVMPQNLSDLRALFLSLNSQLREVNAEVSVIAKGFELPRLETEAGRNVPDLKHQCVILRNRLTLSNAVRDLPIRRCLTIASIEKRAFNAAVITAILSRAPEPSLMTPESVFISREDVCVLYSLMHHIVTTRASAIAMDGGKTKNTTLRSLMPAVENALEQGPFKVFKCANREERMGILARFIVKMGALGTDSSRKILVAENMEAPGVKGFITGMNFCPDGKRRLHPNDTGLLKLRREKRCYFQFDENVRLVLAYILLGTYYGGVITSPDCHESGKGTPVSLTPITRPETQREEITTSSPIRSLSIQGTIVTPSTTITGIFAQEQSLTTWSYREITVTNFVTTHLDYWGIQALATLSRQYTPPHMRMLVATSQ